MNELQVRIKGACFVQILMCFNSALNYVIWRIAFNTVHISRQIYQNSSQKLETFSTPITRCMRNNTETLFECQCIKHESTNWGHSLRLLQDWRDHHFTWSAEPREGLAVFRAKAVPSFLSYFETLIIGPAPGIVPATSCSAIKRSTDWANPTWYKWNLHLYM